MIAAKGALSPTSLLSRLSAIARFMKPVLSITCPLWSAPRHVGKGGDQCRCDRRYVLGDERLALLRRGGARRGERSRGRDAARHLGIGIIRREIRRRMMRQEFWS